jgi:hypothetical protein
MPAVLLDVFVESLAAILIASVLCSKKVLDGGERKDG